LRARKLLALGIAILASGVVAVGCGGDDSSSSSDDNASSSSSSGGKTIKVAYLSDCEGAFGAFYEPDIAGANTAFIKYAGGKAAGSKPSDGLDGATVAGSKIELVGVG
jgi:branched-chain amino acid transport system substrate-binding protein